MPSNQPSRDDLLDFSSGGASVGGFGGAGRVSAGVGSGSSSYSPRPFAEPPPLLDLKPPRATLDLLPPRLKGGELARPNASATPTAPRGKNHAGEGSPRPVEAVIDNIPRTDLRSFSKYTTPNSSSQPQITIDVNAQPVGSATGSSSPTHFPTRIPNNNTYLRPNETLYKDNSRRMWSDRPENKPKTPPASSSKPNGSPQGKSALGSPATSSNGKGWRIGKYGGGESKDSAGAGKPVNGGLAGTVVAGLLGAVGSVMGLGQKQSEPVKGYGKTVVGQAKPSTAPARQNVPYEGGQVDGAAYYRFFRGYHEEYYGVTLTKGSAKLVEWLDTSASLSGKIVNAGLTKSDQSMGQNAIGWLKWQFVYDGQFTDINSPDTGYTIWKKSEQGNGAIWPVLTWKPVRQDGTSPEIDREQGGDPDGETAKGESPRPAPFPYPSSPPSAKPDSSAGSDPAGKQKTKRTPSPATPPAISKQSEPTPEPPPEPDRKDKLESKPKPPPTPFPSPFPPPSPFRRIDPTPQPSPVPDPSPKEGTPPSPSPVTNPTPKIDDRTKPEPNPVPDPKPLPFPVTPPSSFPKAKPAPVPDPKPVSPPNIAPPKCLDIGDPSTCEGQIAKKIDDQGVKQDDILGKVNALLQGIDLSLLTTINSKLGEQVPGGLSGWLGRFSKSLHLDRVYNGLSLMLQVHNALMLSRNLGQSISYVIDSAAQIFKLKDEDDAPIDVAGTVGNTIYGFFEVIAGVELMDGLSKNWKKLSAIYTVAINAYEASLNAMAGIAEGLETVGSYTGRIGNALKRGGAVVENAYAWMDENVRVKTGRFASVQKVTDGLQQANTLTEHISEMTEAVTETTENISNLQTEFGNVKTAIGVKEETKATTETASASTSTSPAIPKTDIIGPNN